MNKVRTRVALRLAAALLLLAAQRPSLAASATWNRNPTSDDWNTPANWTPETVPNSPSDTATFGASDVTALSVSTASVELDEAVFSRGAPAYTVTIEIYNLIFDGTGLVNNSGSMQSIIAPTVDNNDADIFFYNSATAGKMTSFGTVGGLIEFFDTSSAGSATFSLIDSSLQASMDFWDSSTAADATISVSTGANLGFFDRASGGNASVTVTDESFLNFGDDASADHISGTCVGGDQYFGASIDFQQFSSAGEGSFTAVGASTSGDKGADIEFTGSATADHGTFTINGAVGAGLAATTLTFYDTTTAAAAHITANGGVDGSEGGAVVFTKTSKGGEASIRLNGNAVLDITMHNRPGVTIGSLAGAGSVLLGANTLTVGSNNRSTIFSGVIQGSGGVTKSGTGILTLRGTNTYSGNTTVNGGVLVANNRHGATGTGSVNVNDGTLGGRGIILGGVTVGTGSGSGAVLAPSVAAKQPLTLSCKSSVTFKSDGTYTCQLNNKTARADQLAAKGVSIERGAQFDLETVGNKRLSTGTVFTVISNTSASPITGAFANLADGAVISVGRNKLQASYEGGGGNDLTLTVQ